MLTGCSHFSILLQTFHLETHKTQPPLFPTDSMMRCRKQHRGQNINHWKEKKNIWGSMHFLVSTPFPGDICSITVHVCVCVWQTRFNTAMKSSLPAPTTSSPLKTNRPCPRVCKCEIMWDCVSKGLQQGLRVCLLKAELRQLPLSLMHFSVNKLQAFSSVNCNKSSYRWLNRPFGYNNPASRSFGFYTNTELVTIWGRIHHLWDFHSNSKG